MVKIKDSSYYGAMLDTYINDTPYTAFGYFSYDQIDPNTIPKSLHAYYVESVDDHMDTASRITSDVPSKCMGTFITNRKIPNTIIGHVICQKVGYEIDCDYQYYSDFTFYNFERSCKYKTAKEFLSNIRNTQENCTLRKEKL